MSYLYNIIEEELKKKDRNFSWLANQVGYSRQGLKASLTKNTLRVDTLTKIAQTLNISTDKFFTTGPVLLNMPEIPQNLKNSLRENRYKSEINDLNNRITELEEIISLQRDKINFLETIFELDQEKINSATIKTLIKRIAINKVKDKQSEK